MEPRSALIKSNKNTPGAFHYIEKVSSKIIFIFFLNKLIGVQIG
jgi:hypothetical protein